MVVLREVQFFMSEVTPEVSYQPHYHQEHFAGVVNSLTEHMVGSGTRTHDSRLWLTGAADLVNWGRILTADSELQGYLAHKKTHPSMTLP